MGYIKKLGNEIVAYSENKLGDEYTEVSEKYLFGYDNKLYPENYLKSSEYLEKQDKYTENERLSAIRVRREEECFRIINRGQLWYANLKEEQKSELAAWYQAWLDAPQTGVVPTKPSWIK